ncbi:hypothetical protein TanjilG_27827 [Lupinus angustifolius]|uniref:Uncharacterized protein n=1 Tax=Lupinus angustifolius TaxID=3871 RepID=A0A4P1RH99_LUPAN|nr:PREDICTED: uncharacterized protein LOC109348849 [Lupinus angustifolius]OIW10881.1 hypothetical protein TanjilG_27827 [Lupinus angustifolius]
MDCLVMPISLIRRCSTGSRFGYIPLTKDDLDHEPNPVKVMVGKEKKVFFVDPFILQEYPFQFLIDISMKNTSSMEKGHFHFTRSHSQRRVIFVDVDALLFEHMLWLMHNDVSSLFQLNLKEIVEFYAQDM